MGDVLSRRRFFSASVGGLLLPTFMVNSGKAEVRQTSENGLERLKQLPVLSDEEIESYRSYGLGVWQKKHLTQPIGEAKITYRHFVDGPRHSIYPSWDEVQAREDGVDVHRLATESSIYQIVGQVLGVSEKRGRLYLCGVTGNANGPIFRAMGNIQEDPQNIRHLVIEDILSYQTLKPIDE